MDDPLHAILKRSERNPAILGASQVSTWPTAELERWVATGVLRAISPASSLPCLGCGGEHVGEVVFLTDPDSGNVHAYLPCPTCGPSSIPSAALRRWRVDIERLVEVIFAGVVSTLRLVPVQAGRLWRVGRMPGPGGECAVFFGRNLHCADTAEILERARIPTRAVVFAPWYIPAQSGNGTNPLVLPLIPVVSSATGAIHFDQQQVSDSLLEWSEVRADPGKRPPRKRASRAVDIAALIKEMQQHLRAARDYAFSQGDPPRLLPRPSQDELARRIGASQWTVSRCLSDPEARELHFLWELSVDLDRILDYRHS